MMMNRLKISVATLATVGMIAACGGGSIRDSHVSSGVKISSASTCPSKIQFALREFLTDEAKNSLASGAVMQDRSETERVAWVLVSQKDDFWHHKIYFDKQTNRFSKENHDGSVELTLVMYGTKIPTIQVQSTETTGVSATSSFLEESARSQWKTHSDQGIIRNVMIYDIFDDLNFAYVDLSDSASDNSMTESPLGLNRSHHITSSNPEALPSLYHSGMKLFPNLLDLTWDSQSEVTSDHESSYVISDNDKKRLIKI